MANIPITAFILEAFVAGGLYRKFSARKYNVGVTTHEEE